MSSTPTMAEIAELLHRAANMATTIPLPLTAIEEHDPQRQHIVPVARMFHFAVWTTDRINGPPFAYSLRVCAEIASRFDPCALCRRHLRFTYCDPCSRRVRELRTQIELEMPVASAGGST